MLSLCGGGVVYEEGVSDVEDVSRVLLLLPDAVCHRERLKRAGSAMAT